MKLTPLQRKIMKLMRSNEDSIAVSYSNGRNSYFRILTKDKSPLLNAKQRAFKKLIQLELIVHSTVDFQRVYTLSKKGLSLRFNNIKNKENIVEEAVFDASKINTQIQSIEDVATLFHKWMKENDTAENAEKYFHFSDKDMFNEFLKSKS